MANDDQGMPQLAPLPRFLSRIRYVALLAVALLMVTLLIGTVGYWILADLPLIEAFHQASMLLAGMGPVIEQTKYTPGVRIFESVYAIFCGVVLLGSTGVLFAPIIHRLLHRFHLEDAGPDQ